MAGFRSHTLLCLTLMAVFLPCALMARPENAGPKTQTPSFVEVRFHRPVKFSHLKKGDVLRGEVARNVFSRYRLMIPAGSQVSLTVSGMERRRKESSNKWPWPAEYFRPKYEAFPTFDLLTASLPAGRNASFPILRATTYDEIHLTAGSVKGGKSGARSKRPVTGSRQNKAESLPRGSSLELVVDAQAPAGETATTAEGDSASRDKAEPAIETLAAGTETRLALVDRLSASANQAGDAFKAVLAEPLRLSSGEIVPEGSVLEGRVGKRTPPRWLSRPGSINLTFNRLLLPSGTSIPIAASVVGVEADRNTRMKVDSEGRMSGGSPGRKRLLIDVGISFAFSKVADDTYQLIAEGLVSTATDASTAGTARLVGMAVGGFLFIKRRGRNVVLPPYSIIDIRFDRSPALLSPGTPERGIR